MTNLIINIVIIMNHLLHIRNIIETEIELVHPGEINLVHPGEINLVHPGEIDLVPQGEIVLVRQGEVGTIRLTRKVLYEIDLYHQNEEEVDHLEIVEREDDRIRSLMSSQTMRETILFS